MRKLSLTKDELATFYLLLDKGDKGNSRKELKLIDQTLDEIENACTFDKTGINIEIFVDMELELEEAVYNLAQKRMERMAGWTGSGRKVVFSLEDKLDQAELIKDKE